MDTKELVKNIQEELLKLSSPEVKQKVERLTSGAKCIGVTVPNLRSLAKTVKTTNKVSVD